MIPEKPWRIVLLSQILPATLGLDAIARAVGHETIALLTPRLHESAPDDMRERHRDLLAGLARVPGDVAAFHLVISIGSAAPHRFANSMKEVNAMAMAMAMAIFIGCITKRFAVLAFIDR